MTRVPSDDFDIAVVGGGPVGLTLALGLSESEARVCVLEARDTTVSLDDPRTLALSYSSRLVLERIGVWHRLHATPITRIHVSQRGRFGRAELNAHDERLPALGYVVRYGALLTALRQELASRSISYLAGAEVQSLDPNSRYIALTYRHRDVEDVMTSRLAVVADGGGTLVNLHGVTPRRRDYGQRAVVAEVQLSRAPDGTAYERFTSGGPAALLPIEDRYALVYTATPDEAQALLDLGEADFLTRLQVHFGDYAGRFVEVGTRKAFPLSLSFVESVTAPRTVLIGNAAQILHPVAGQGINLGIRDAWSLAQQVQASGAEALGTEAFLGAYQRSRLLDTTGGIVFTDALVRLFSNDLAGLRWVRGLGLTLFDIADPLKHFLVRRMTFGAPRGHA